MTTSSYLDYDDIDIHDVLKTRNQVAIVWGIDDVQILRPDLDDDQAWEVLIHCEDHHDCGLGFNWHLIDATAESLFPEPEDSAAEGEEAL